MTKGTKRLFSKGYQAAKKLFLLFIFNLLLNIFIKKLVPNIFFYCWHSFYGNAVSTLVLELTHYVIMIM